ncbi:MarR family transcriptional regulator [Actinomadura madurae]|uniref:DNA-binding transcriptional regulator, MarR family n=1 Tax=Actinomadura madurae TaxID=1993 RepID=A0A1I5V9Y5_9ACTN|nr:MarR family transcriptional regulator [Actinomadura madurae]SFQ04333.1 DNA-binding transcriptional regulator, MarR family [Actinomadura madurae]SPT60507.1 Multiple antibiotic resistance protein marR [Actinomadura madurae]
MGDRDRTDEHVARWTPILPDLDPDTEGAVTRMGRFVKHIKRVREDLLVASGLQRHEYDTLHALAGRHGTAAPSELAADLGMPPNSITGRLDALERRGFVHRSPSATDRRRVVVELTPEGRAAWREALDGVGDEETRLLAALTPDERRTLSDLLRRVMLRAEQDPS